MKKNKLSFLQKIQAYHMTSNLVIAYILLTVNLLALLLYVIFPEIRENDICNNIFVAIITGLFATILSTGSEIFIEFKNNERGEFLEDIYSFGIMGLSQEKGKVLENELAKCRRLIWISGYRLILTDRLKEKFADAVKAGVNVQIVVCPPWLSGFQMVYGKDETVMDNYFRVFHALREATKRVGSDLTIRFTEKPLFSDTYRVDERIITGPYLHNKDDKFHRIMANDFFTYIVKEESPLHRLVEDEYYTVYEEAVSELNLEKFDRIWEETYAGASGEMTEEEKMDLMKGATDPFLK